MPTSCLGIQIEENVIKYAKVKKEKDSIKVEAFNVVFYENLNSTIRQIVTETNSLKTPISINLSGEMYNYFQVSSMLNRQDMKKAVEIDFDLLCEERNHNKKTLETRFLFAQSYENKEKMQAIAISGTQADLTQKKIAFAEYKLDSVNALSTSITNLIDPNEKSNVAIINIEEQTKLTIMSNGEIILIDSIAEGMRDIINKINMIENSKRKSYEVCKNTTLYSQDSEDVASEGNEHLDSIMPTLYSIASKAKEIIEDSGINVSKVYITGLATSINNIDLYFQECFEKIKCEILKPFFAKVTSIKTSIKDYIEVNSAIALALSGMGYGYRELNFINGGKSYAKIDFGLPSGKGLGLTGTLDAIEKMFIRITIACLIGIVAYIGFSMSISDGLEKKTEEINTAITKIDQEISKADSDLVKIKKQTETYKTAIEELKSLEANKETKVIIKKQAIPNLLYNFVEITPKKVQILSVENIRDTNHIVITACSPDYEQLGFFKAAITTNNYLMNVKSTSGTKSEGMITTTIEGDLKE